MVATSLPHESLLDPDRKPVIIPLLEAERQAILRSRIMTGWEYFCTCGRTLRGDEALPVDGAKTPYLREPFDVAMQPRKVYTRLGFFSSTQVGKTTFVTNVTRGRTHLLGGNCLFGFPDEGFARAFMKREYLPRLKADPLLAPQLPQEGTQEYRTKITHEDIYLPRGTIMARALGSAIKTKSATCSTVAVDEVEDVPLDVDGQGDPLDLIEKRKAWYKDSHGMTILTGTFGSAGGHAQLVWESMAHARYLLPCPACGEHGIIDIDDAPFHGGTPVFVIEIDKGAGLDDLDRPEGDALVRMRCPHCAASIAPRQVRKMVASGRFVCTVRDSESDLERGETIDNEGVIHSVDPQGNPIRFLPGEYPTPATSVYRAPSTAFWLNAACSPVVSVREFAAEWVRTRHAIEDSKRQDFSNNWRAMPMRTTTHTTSPASLRGRIDQLLPPGILPSDTRLVTMACDVQKEGLWWTRVAWGALLRGHLVDFGYIKEPNGWTIQEGHDVPESVEQLFALGDEWLFDADGHNEQQAELAFIDCGEGKRDTEIVGWTLRHAAGVWKPCKGVDTGEKIVAARIIDAIASGGSSRERTKRFNVHKAHTGDWLHNVLTKPTHSAEAFTFHAEKTIDPETGEEISMDMPVLLDVLFKHICAVEKERVVTAKRGAPGTRVEREFWRKKNPYIHDDLWACLRYTYAAARVRRDEQPDLFEPDSDAAPTSRRSPTEAAPAREPDRRSDRPEERIGTDPMPEPAAQSPTRGFVMPRFESPFGR